MIAIFAGLLIPVIYFLGVMFSMKAIWKVWGKSAYEKQEKKYNDYMHDYKGKVSWTRSPQYIRNYTTVMGWCWPLLPLFLICNAVYIQGDRFVNHIYPGTVSFYHKVYNFIWK
jgi:hypothetical protein